MSAIIIGIAGGSGSGKTTLAQHLKDHFGGSVTVIGHDSYYKRQEGKTYEERALQNYDHPDAFETDLLIRHLRELFDIKIFVETDADERILRRCLRDVEERGRTLRSVVTQYLTTVKPMHEQYVEPSRKYADIIVLEGGHNLVALEMIMQRIQNHIDKE